jgi:hypothetical protein
MTIKLIIRATFACLVALSFSADSALVGRLADSNGDFQAYHDTEEDLTWLADANFAYTSGYIDTISNTYNDGRMTWGQANNWAADLNVEGVDGWRLADADLCSAYACYGGEILNLFSNVLGGSAGTSIVGSHNANYDLFSNVQNNRYWSATEYEPITNFHKAWYLSMYFGHVGSDSQTVESYAWALQSGDVSAVPVPATVWLLGSGLLGLVGLTRRKA